VSGEGPAAILREAPSSGSRAVATAAPGAVFEVDFARAGFFRVSLGKNRHAWVAASDTIPGGKPRPRYLVRLLEAPEIRVAGELVRQVTGDKTEIRGSVVHPEQVRDLMVFVGDRKILYQPNPDPATAKQIDFNLEVPLEEGANFITLVSRYNDEVLSSLPIFVRRASHDKMEK
jgi:hypothetical protein